MTPATRSLLAHAAPAARWGTSIVLFVLLLGMLPAALTAPLGAASPHAPTTVARAQTALVPSAACNNYNGSQSVNFQENQSQGQVPLAIQFNLTTVNMPTPYTYTIAFGDGKWANGTVSSACYWGVPLTTLFNHTYTFPEVYMPWINVRGGGGTVGYGMELYAWGAAGPNPFIVTTNVSSGSVPLAIHYSSVPANPNVPSGLSYYWNIYDQSGYASLNTGAFTPNGGNVTARAPGLVTGTLTAQYANGTTFDVTNLPVVTVAPVLNVTLGVAATNGSSPFTATFWANATNASDGGVPTIPYTDNWTFGDGKIAGGGSPVTHVYWDNNSVYWGVTATVSLEDLSGNILGFAQRFLLLVNGTVGAPPPIRVTLTPWYPGTGPAPFTLNASVSATGGFTPYGLEMVIFNGSSAPPSTPTNYSPIWVDVNGSNSDKISNWNGSTVQSRVNFSTPGQYVLAAYVNDRNASTPYGVAWYLVNVTAPVPPIYFSISASPLNGTAPLNVSFVTSASGGTAPYILVIGIQNLTPIQGTNVSNWSGASLTSIIDFNQSGNWSVVDAVQDHAGHVVFGPRFYIRVAAPTPAAPLIVTAAFVPLTSSGSESFRFSASVVGGVAPYTLVWNFGDGSSQPGSLSGTVDHTYQALGTYYPSVTVTDHSGRQLTRQLGTLVVTTGPAPGVGPAAAPTWAIAFVLTTILWSALAIAVVVRWATHRREGLNWVRPFEEPSDGRTRPPSAP